MSKVDVPRNVEELLTLASDVYAKHVSDGPSSPLNHLGDFNFDQIGPNLVPALAKHKEAEDYARKAKEAYEQRNVLMGDVEGVVKCSRDLLKAKFAKTPRKLGEWGFDVKESAVVAKIKNSTPDA